MENKEYRKMFELEGTYWWYVGRRFVIEQALKYCGRDATNNRAADVGCGTGINLSLLARYYDEVLGLDNSPEALNYCRLRGHNNVKLINGVSHLALDDNSFDMVTALDVLEHLDDDAGAVKELSRITKKGGRLIVTVPAYKFLWSEHDVALHHKRRYTISQARQLLLDNNFKILKSSYIISFSFPIIVVYRAIKGTFNKIRHTPPHTSHVLLPKFANNFLISLLKLEAFLTRFVDFPFGTSIIIVAQKA